jgi:hypothetical protein
MSVALATKGMICPCIRQTVPGATFSPILKFDVALVLEKPLGFIIEATEELAKPSGLMVENIVASVSTPKGFFVEGEAPLGVPSGFDVEDTNFVAAPVGFAVEDI